MAFFYTINNQVGKWNEKKNPFIIAIITVEYLYIGL